jgi:hypothetical protein
VLPGRHDELHPALAADPSKQECVAANESAQDLQRGGKLIDARVQLATCIATSCPAAVRADCASRLEELTRVQPTVVFGAQDAGGGDLGAVRVTMDGKRLLDRLGGNAVPIDPGEHHLLFEADGFAAVEKLVVVRIAEKDRVVRVTMERPAVVAPAPPPVATPAPSPPPVAATPAPAAAPESNGVPSSAWASFGVAAAGVVAGGVFAVLWVKAKNDGDAACGAAGACDAPTANDWESKQRSYTIGLAAGFGVAAAGAVLGLVLLSSGHHSAPVAASWRGLEARF